MAATRTVDPQPSSAWLQTKHNSFGLACIADDVLPGGSPGLDYVRLMVRVLEGAPDIILFGCGGGALASELHNRGCRMTLVDDNPISFDCAVTGWNVMVGPKRLEILHELLPSAINMALLVNPTSPNLAEADRTICPLTNALRSALRSRRLAQGSCICHPTRPTSIQSRWPSPSSKRLCGRPPPARSRHSWPPSPKPSPPSHPRNAQTSSPRPAMIAPDRNLL